MLAGQFRDADSGLWFPALVWPGEGLVKGGGVAELWYDHRTLEVFMNRCMT